MRSIGFLAGLDSAGMVSNTSRFRAAHSAGSGRVPGIATTWPAPFPRQDRLAKLFGIVVATEPQAERAGRASPWASPDGGQRPVRCANMGADATAVHPGNAGPR